MGKRWLLSLAVIAGAWACSHNSSTQIVNEEFVVKSDSGQRFYTGLQIPKDYNPKNVRAAPKLKLGETLPEAFDWRTKAELMPIRNQGSCGSCYAFSTMATFEDSRRIFGGDKADTSEQYIVSCNTEGWSCNGGFFGYDMLKRPKGSILEIDYPYTATDGNCKGGLSYKAPVVEWAYLPGGDNAGNDIEGMKTALMKFGPLGVGVAVNDAFSNYTGGIFQDTGFRSLNHAVNIVGWNNADGGYWIMRNSWGNWGESGFMRIRFGANGIGAWPNYVITEKGDPSPNPDPTPDPDPTPPPPPPPPPSCKPQPYAYTGYGDQISVSYGTTINIGTRQLAGHTYRWVASPAFDQNAVPTAAQIRYTPRITKRLTVYATTRCGTAFHGTTVNMLPSKKLGVKLKPEVQ
jgi:hypothetical protein